MRVRRRRRRAGTGRQAPIRIVRIDIPAVNGARGSAGNQGPGTITDRHDPHGC